MSKAKAPEWMVDAAQSALTREGCQGSRLSSQRVADAICQAIQDNFPKPTDEEMRALINRTLAFPKDHVPNPDFKWGFNIGVRWANESLFRSEPEVPEALADLIHRYGIEEDSCEMQIAREAYRRGKESK